MRTRIVVVGSSNTDMIITVPHLPRPGETIMGGRFAVAGGGKGANQAVAAARCGGQVDLIARIGSDSFGASAVTAWLQDGIGVDLVVKDEAAPSGVALIFVDTSAENCIAVAPGANDALAPADIDRGAAAIAAAAILLVQLEIPLESVRHALAVARRHGTRTILNPAPARTLDDALLRDVSIITPNETEAELLTGVRIEDDASAEQAAAMLLRRGPDTVIITLGSRGAFVATGTMRTLVPGFRVNAVDTVAAGDVFNGALAVALAEGRPLTECIRFGHAAAAISVTRHGAQPSAPRRDEIQRLLDGQPVEHQTAT
jgi:ribokinase